MSNPAAIIFGVVGILAATIMAVIYHRQAQATQNTPHTSQPRQRAPPTRVQRPPILNRDCSICEEEIRPNQEVKTILCGHRFHTYCIRSWLEHSLVCPYCLRLAE